MMIMWEEQLVDPPIAYITCLLLSFACSPLLVMSYGYAFFHRTFFFSMFLKGWLWLNKKNVDRSVWTRPPEGQAGM